MENLISIICTVIGALALVCAFSCLSGFVLWILYPHIHALFPNAVTNGILAKDLGLWDSICIVWIFSILFTKNNTIKKD